MAKKRVSYFVIRVPVTPGICRWCRCTWEHACEGGCSWANRAQTLCSSCVNFDRLITTVRGRAELVAAYNEWQDQLNTNKPARTAAGRERRR